MLVWAEKNLFIFHFSTVFIIPVLFALLLSPLHSCFSLSWFFLGLWHGMFFCNMTKTRVWWAVDPSQTRRIQPGAGAKESVRGVWVLRGYRSGAPVIFMLRQLWAPPTKEITMSRLPFPCLGLHYRTDGWTRSPLGLCRGPVWIWPQTVTGLADLSGSWS